MCGISGFAISNLTINNSNLFNLYRDKLVMMKNSLKHRGPDDDNIFLSSNFGLAHTRLSIRDIKKGAQPMKCQYKNREAIIVYNGELYNTEDIKFRLKNCGITFSTTSDTEVILYAYLVFGTEIFKDLNGIFAFCIYENNNMILVRDHLGVKPLFYYFDGKKLVFSSEPKGIFAYGIKPSITEESYQEIIGLGPAHTPGKSVFSNIKEVLPGNYINVKIDSSSIMLKNTQYWKLEDKPHTEDYQSTIRHCCYLVEDSIKKQMISDIPICTFLSGGLDSSLVSAIVQANLPKKNLNTFSFDFKDNDKNFVPNSFQSSSDKPYATYMSEYIKSNHTFLECDNDNQIKYLKKSVVACDAPSMADVTSSMLYFCEKVSKKCHVTLTGECADEIFGGYPWFHKKDMLLSNTFPWSKNLDFRKSVFNKEFVQSLDLDNYVNNAYESTINSCPSKDTLTKDYKLFDTNRKKITWLNVNWFMATLLNRMDRCSMYSGLEARVPFADYRILEYVYNTPWQFKCVNNYRKSLLINCGKKYLPKEILYRKKSPYPKSYDINYEKKLGELLLEEINDNQVFSNLINKKYINEFILSPKDYGKPWYGQLMAGPQMLAYLLQISYWLKIYN